MLLVFRLNKFLSKVISHCQSSFLMGRNILDGVVVENEIFYLERIRKDKCLLLKVVLKRHMIQLIVISL